MTKADLIVERGAQRLQELADKAASRGDGVGTWLSEELRTDAAFLRKLKPSLVKARARGEAPAPHDPAPPQPSAQQPDGEEPAAPPPPPPPPAASRRPKAKPKKKKARRGGPPPIVIVGAAFVAGILIAKVVDWRGHAHPRD